MKKMIVYAVGAALVFTLVSAVYAVNGGDENDPLVTQSYVDSQINEIKTYFEEKINILNTNVDQLKANLGNSQGGTSTAAYELVSLKNGQKLICGSGTELILRAGYASSIGSVEGGLADVTSGVDIEGNKDIPRNHLLIIPRNDGRGIVAKAPNNTIVMIKGSYNIK